jgi:hypothetical protein
VTNSGRTDSNRIYLNSHTYTLKYVPSKSLKSFTLVLGVRIKGPNTEYKNTASRLILKKEVAGSFKSFVIFLFLDAYKYVKCGLFEYKLNSNKLIQKSSSLRTSITRAPCSFGNFFDVNVVYGSLNQSD